MTKRINSIEKNGIDYVSAKQMQEKGYVINPFALLNKNNSPVYQNGEIVDVLVPLDEIDITFKKTKL